MTFPRSLFVIPAVLMLAPLHATEAPAAEGTAESTLSTVVVTGERELEQIVTSGALGSKSLLDTPFSLTVIDAEDIARRQASSLGQVFFNDPSVLSASPAGTTNWWGAQIRGLGVRNYYIDGVPMELSWGGDFPLEAVQSVEALKGLGGFMYGFGAPGGVMTYVTKQPTDTPLLSTELGYRNDSVMFGQVDAGGRLGGEGKLGYRVNVAGEFGDAYTTAGVNRGIAALALDYAFTETLQWYGNTLYEKSRLEHEPLYFYWDAYEGEALPEPTYDYRKVTVDNSFYKTETLKGTTGIRWQFADAWSADVNIGYSRKQHWSNKMFGYLLNQAGDYEGEAYNFAGDLRNYVTQAIVQGRLMTGSIRHDLVFGANYQRTTGQWSNDWHWSNDFNGNLYQQQTFSVTRDIDFSLAPISDDQRQTGVFASDTLHFADHWQAVLGLRYNDFDLKDRDGDPSVDSGYATDAFTPTIALIFKPLEQVSLYGSYVEALEQGSRVGEDYANFGEIFDATTSRQYEVGAKLETSRASLTAAAFRVERAAEIEQFEDGLRYLTQDGLTLYEGLEVIGSYGITSNLRLGAGATWLDASIEEVSADNAALAGNRPAGAAEWQVVGNAEYVVPRVQGLSVHGTVRYFGNAYYEDLNRVLIPHRTLTSVGFQYQTRLRDQTVAVTGNLNNLFNQKYWELNQLGEGVNGSLGLKVSW